MCLCMCEPGAEEESGDEDVGGEEEVRGRRKTKENGTRTGAGITTSSSTKVGGKRRRPGQYQGE